jgi:hypothetical protein
MWQDMIAMNFLNFIIKLVVRVCSVLLTIDIV